MKLLVDQNLSPLLVHRLADLFPGSLHVCNPGLDRALDAEVWSYARDNGFILVSKDSDFSDLSVLHGHPPKVIWLKVGNCTTDQVEEILRSNFDAIQHLADDGEAAVLTLY